MLDRYERLIEATRLAGREPEAFELFSQGMGGYRNLAWVLGEYQRGYRILTAFSSTGLPEDIGSTLELRRRFLLSNALALFASHLGRLAETWLIRQVCDEWATSLGEPEMMSQGLQNSSYLAFSQGRLVKSLSLADAAVTEAETSKNRDKQRDSLGFRAVAAHELGDIAAARTDFAAATKVAGHPLVSFWGSCHARHHLELAELASSRTLCHHGLDVARALGYGPDSTRFLATLARLDLAEGNDPTVHLDEVRSWTSRTGEVVFIIEAHLLTGRHLLASGDLQAALGEAETGLLHAVACGYGLLRIELLVALGRIRLAWPDAPKAIQAAREALNLATHPECQYAWGEADAAQLWGEAYFANYEPTLAKRAFTQALKVRQRIEHPGVADTEKWLARTG